MKNMAFHGARCFSGVRRLVVPVRTSTLSNMRRLVPFPLLLALVFHGSDILEMRTSAATPAAVVEDAAHTNATPSPLKLALPRDSNPILEEARADYERNPLPYKAILLADAYLAAGKRDQALQILRATLATPGLDARMALEIGARLEKAGDAEGSRMAQARAAAQTPAQAAGQDRLAAIRKAFQDSPTAQNGATLFLALAGVGRTNEAHAVLNNLQNRAFATGSDYLVVSDVLAWGSRFEQAEAAAQQALRLDTNSSTAYLMMARAKFGLAIQHDVRLRNALLAHPSGDIALPDDLAARLIETLETAFQVSLSVSYTNEPEVNPISFAIRGTEPWVVALRSRSDFRNSLLNIWIPRWRKAQEQKDPAYFKLANAAELLRQAKSEKAELFSEIQSIAPQTFSVSSSTANRTVEQAARLLKEAFAIHRAQMETNAAVEPLLISALLNQNIMEWITNSSIEPLIFYQLATTPISKRWCEDFSEHSTFIPGKDAGRISIGVDILGKFEPARRKALALPSSKLYDRRLPRPEPWQPHSTNLVPAVVERIGPDTVVNALNNTGDFLGKHVSASYANAEFIQAVDHVVRELFAKGYSAEMFTFSGTETLDEEAAKTLVQHVAQHLLLRIVPRGPRLYLVVQSAYEIFDLVEFEGPLRIRVHRQLVSEVARRNGVLWAGDVTVHYDSIGRLYSEGKWRNWEELDGELESYPLVQYEEGWHVRWLGRQRFFRPSFRQIEEALATQAVRRRQ